MEILDLFFPKGCLGCRAEGKYLCADCVSKAKRAQPICPYCKHPSIDGFTHVNCQKRFGLDGLTSIWEYEGVIRKAILSLKYKYATEIGSEISEYIINSLSKEILPLVYNLVPIPIYWHKQNTRGFNQAVELGGNIAVNLRLKFIPNLLIKRRPTVSQAGLSREERVKNLKNTFVINSKLKIPDSVLLFDDVFTTGSTLFEAAKILKKGGATKVWGLTVAR